MKKLTLIFIAVATLLFSGCGYKEGAVSGGQKSHIFFTGSMESVSVSLDGSDRFNAKVGKTQLYKVAPGKHNVKVYNGDVIAVDRDIYVGSGTDKEIEVPNVQ